MFSNAHVYRIDHWTPPAAAALEERLNSARFVECGATQPESDGWIEPRGEDHGALLESVGGQWIARLRVETKAVPAGIVKTELEVLLDRAEKETGRRPKGKHARELKDEVVQALLPRAFPKRSDTWVWIDTTAQRVLVGASSSKGADRVVTRLLETLGGDLKLSLLQTELSPATAMAAWLSDKTAPVGFSVDRECELKQPDSEKSAVRYARHTLDIDEVGEHIRQGKLPTQLALTWNERVAFVLTDALVLKKISLLDVALEGADADHGFDADVAISTGELRRMIPALIDALGGPLQTPGDALSSEAAMRPETAHAPDAIAAATEPVAKSSAKPSAKAAAEEAPPW